MKKNLFVLMTFLLAACNNASVTSTAEKTDTTQLGQVLPASTVDFSGCYRKVLQRDTILLHIQQSGDSVSGTMSFDNYQKDSSRGTVKGSVQNDTLVLWYDFFSEGMHSVMEIILKKTEDGLVRAVGPFEAKGDTSLFKNHNELKFDPQQTLKKIECTK